MRYILLLFLSTLLFNSFTAVPLKDQSLIKLIAASPSAKDLPGEEACTILREVSITVEATGKVKMRERRVMKILTEAGLPLSQWSIPYDKSTVNLDYVSARTIVKNEIYTVDPTHIAENALYPGVAQYNSFFVRRFPMPAATVGAILDVETVISRKSPRIAEDFSDRLYLSDSYFTSQLNFAIYLPAIWHPSWRLTNTERYQGTEKITGERRVITVTGKNIPANRIVEPQTPPADEMSDQLRISTLSGFKDIAKWFNAISNTAVIPDDNLKKITEQITEKLNTTEEKIIAIDKVVRNMPYVAIEFGSMSDIPNKASDILKRGYADCKDKVTLMKTMLSVIGVKSWYVLVRTADRGKLDKKLPSPAEFNHVIIAVEFPTGEKYLDPTETNAPWNVLPQGVAGADGLIIKDYGEIIQLPVNTNNNSIADALLVINNDGSCTGDITITMEGLPAITQRSALMLIKPDRLKETFAPLAQRFGAEMKIDDIKVENLQNTSKPLAIMAKVSSPTFIQQAGPMLCGNMPWLHYQPNRYQQAVTRTMPFYNDTVSTMTIQEKIKLPNGWKVTYLPTTINYDGLFGKYHDESTFKDGVITYHCELQTKTVSAGIDALKDAKDWSSILAFEKRNSLQWYVTKE
jgi:transglutaminase-like putative cysteine protease